MKKSPPQILQIGDKTVLKINDQEFVVGTDIEFNNSEPNPEGNGYSYEMKCISKKALDFFKSLNV